MSHTIAYFKMDENGVRQRRKMVLDDARNWVSDAPAPLATPPAGPTPRSSSAQESELQRDGIQYERLSPTTLLLTHVPPAQTDVMSIFSKDAECPEPLRALKAAYFSELDAITSDPECPSLDCAQARLIRAYKKRAEEIVGLTRK